MFVLLVRHADAGDRGAWGGPDEQRPLTDRGRGQARGLVRLLGDRWAVSTLVSSPSVRCIETLAPLAAAFGLGIEVDDRFAEGSEPEAALAAVVGFPRGVVCSHGDVIPGVLEVLAAGGVDLGPAPRCQKASTWVLELGAAGVVGATYLPPP